LTRSSASSRSSRPCGLGRSRSAPRGSRTRRPDRSSRPVAGRRSGRGSGRPRRRLSDRARRRPSTRARSCFRPDGVAGSFGRNGSTRHAESDSTADHARGATRASRRSTRLRSTFVAGARAGRESHDRWCSFSSTQAGGIPNRPERTDPDIWRLAEGYLLEGVGTWSETAMASSASGGTLRLIRSRASPMASMQASSRSALIADGERSHLVE
jgi:hypothetical protein